MTTTPERGCPGCGLRMPARRDASYDGSFNCSPECWSVFAEVVGAEFGDAVLFGQVHQLTVDAYAVQHAGGAHPDKSVDIHLVGLHLVLEKGFRPPSVPRLLQRLAGKVETWPHLPPPPARETPTILEIALADSPEEHVDRVKAWAGEVWRAWSPHHAAVAGLADRHLGLD